MYTCIQILLTFEVIWHKDKYFISMMQLEVVAGVGDDISVSGGPGAVPGVQVAVHTNTEHPVLAQRSYKQLLVCTLAILGELRT